MIPFADAVLAALDHADHARVCVCCGQDATQYGLWLDADGHAAGPMVGVTALCDAEECQREKDAIQTLMVRVERHRLVLADDTVRTVLVDMIVDRDMWIGDDGEPLDHSPEREARIARFVDDVALRVAGELRER